MLFSLARKVIFFGFAKKESDAIVYTIENDKLRKLTSFPEVKQSIVQNVYLKEDKLFILTKSGYHVLNSKLELDDKKYETDKYLSELIRIGNRQLLSTTTNGIWITPDTNVKSGANLISHKLVPFFRNYKNTIYYSTYEGGFYSIFPKKTYANIKLPREARVQTDYFGNYFSFSATLNHHLQFDNNELRLSSLMASYRRVSYVKELDMYLVSGSGFFALATNKPSTERWIEEHFDVLNVKEHIFFNGDPGRTKSKMFILYQGRNSQAIFQPADSSFYLVTADGPFHYFPGKTKEKIVSDSSGMEIRGLLRLTDGTMIANTNYGFYKINKGSFVPLLTEADGLKLDEIHGLKIINDTLLIFGNNDIKLFDEQAGFFKTYSSHTNLPDGEIINATLRNGQIYVGTKEGFFTGPVTPDKESKPKAYIRYVLAGEKRWPQEEKIPFARNDIVFYVNCLDLFNRGAFHYEYKLAGSNNAKWVEQDASFNRIRFSSLSEGDYTLQVKVVSDLDQESEVVEYPFTIKPPFVRSWLFYLLCFLFALGIAILIFYLRTRAIRRKAEFEKQVKQSEITAIKAQMNPHFVFNALNSIQSWVVTKDVKNSNLYLGKFSKLVRKTLEVSEKNAIPLSEELYIIQLYLDLENLRFSESIQIDFKVEIPTEEHDDIYLPAMLIQPYIENVFKHGLLHKKGSKHLEIVFAKENSKLLCTIKDNGVGRKRSAEINKKKKRHTSFSTRANEKRIQILNEMFNNEIGLEVTDAYPD